MKLILTSFLLYMVATQNLCAQNGKIPPVDKSPMDMSYYPQNYPILKIQDKVNEPLLARVIYSRPQKNGREVFGELIEFGEIWRCGANEATELELYKDAKLGDTKIKKGRYSVYAIPNPGTWTIIVNRETDTWGAFKYDPAKDVARYTVTTETMNEAAEDFSMIFEKGNNGTILLNVYWDHYKVSVPFVF